MVGVGPSCSLAIRGCIASEGGLENVGVGKVAAFGTILPGGPNTEAAALSRVQEGGKDGRAVEAREAEPVERAVPGYEPRAPAVADKGIVVYGRVDYAFRCTIRQHTLTSDTETLVPARPGRSLTISKTNSMHDRTAPRPYCHGSISQRGSALACDLNGVLTTPLRATRRDLRPSAPSRRP